MSPLPLIVAVTDLLAQVRQLGEQVRALEAAVRARAEPPGTAGR